MATLDQLETALRNADAAGDTQAATVLAREIVKMRQPAAVSAGKDINSVPRQLGLTARYGIEGLANAAQLVTEPIRAVTDLFTPDRKLSTADLVTGQKAHPKSMPLGVVASQFADTLGLPKPEGANERVIGDATRLVAGAGGMGGAARLAGAAPGAIGQAGQFLSSNMGAQLSSAAGAGLAGGASREAGGSPLMQGGAALAGGVGGGLAPGVVQSAVNAGRSYINSFRPQQLDVQVQAAMQRAGVDWAQLPPRVQQALRNDLADALNAGRELDPAAVRRLADFRLVGATPTRGMVSQDPVQITREMNLAKTGANSSDQGLQGLARVQNQNNATFIQRLNEVGGRTETEPIAAGRAVVGSVLGRQGELRGAETAAWNQARTSPGYRQPIEANVVSRINQALGDEALMPYLDQRISRYMESFMNGQQPFTPQAYRNLQSMLSNEMSKGGNEAAAAGLARRVLEQAELRPITNPRGIDLGNAVVTQDTANRLRAMDAAPREAIDAVNQARGATRAAYAYEESSPLVRSVLSDGRNADPTRIAQQFVIGGTPDEAAVVAREVGPAGREVIKNALATYIKKEAMSGANDDVGKVSQSALNTVLRKIGEEKLRLFFTPEEITLLQSASRVASYAQVQPVGSAVGNSNTAAVLLGKGIDALAGISNSLPVIGPMVSQPITNGIQGLNLAIRTNQAQNVAPGLLMQQPRRPLAQGLLLPGMAAGGTAAGLLAAP